MKLSTKIIASCRFKGSGFKIKESGSSRSALQSQMQGSEVGHQSGRQMTALRNQKQVTGTGILQAINLGLLSLPHPKILNCV
jgi:hypothetical protein